MNQPFNIIFNDEYIVVLNKIAKILVHPSSKNEKNTLTFLLREKLGEAVFPCHRLDRETSGLIIFARNRKIQNEIMNQFRVRGIEKRYLALVKGRLNKRSGFLRDYIIDQDGRKFGEKPKEAKTLYSVLKEFDEFSMLELKPLTGRTNQLRIQLSKLGHPILGERKYAFRRDFKVDFNRLALHAFFLSFIHPVSRERVSLKIDLPQDMKKFTNEPNF